MSDLQKPLRDAALEVAPDAIRLSRKTWSEFVARPELQELIRKFDVSSDAGKLRLTGGSASERARLADLVSDSAAPPSGAGASEQVNRARFELLDSTDSANLPALRSANPGDAPPGIGSPPPPVDEGRPPLSAATKTGIALGGAGLAGAGMYAAAGEESEQAAAATPPPGSKLGGGTTSSPGAVGDAPPVDKPDPKREVPRVEAQTVSTPEEFSNQLDELEAARPSDSTKTEWTDADDAKWNSQLADLRSVYAAATKRNQWAEVAEKLGHALTRFFAAKSGLKSGVDMSGIQFDKTDWSRKQDSLLQELKMDVGLVDAERGRSRENVGAARGRLDKWRESMRHARRDKAGAEAVTGQANARAKQGASEANARLSDSELERQTREGIEGRKADIAARKAATAALGARIRNDLTKQAALRKVVNQVMLSSDLDNLDDRNMMAARAQFVSSGLGELEEFDSLLSGIDRGGWQSDEDMRQGWKIGIERAAGLSSGATPGGAPPTGDDVEARIAAVMQQNPGSTREQVISELKKAGKLPADY